MTAVLGISAFYHDSAAAIVIDGRIVAAAQEERFTRKRHDAAFPQHAVEYCLRESRLTEADIDFVAFYEKPLIKFDRLLETYLSFAPCGFRSFAMAIPVWLKDKLHIKRTIRNCLPHAKKAKFVFPEHHESHAASAFFPSPFEDAAILTMDGVGEWATTTWGVGHGNRLALKQQINFPHSLGLLYSAFTYHCGFKVNSGEYKLMGLAPYGRPIYVDRIWDKLVDLRDDGSFWLDMKYFGYGSGLTMTNDNFSDLFGTPARKPESQLEPIHMDLAASIQAATEEIILRTARHIAAQTDIRTLVLAGGVALNCVANGLLLRSGIFSDIWIQPASGDAGGALGAALFTWYQLLNNHRSQATPDHQEGSLLGPSFQRADIINALEASGLPYCEESSDESLARTAAEHLRSERILGWFQGRMEYGPRALGTRSILGDPRCPDMQAKMNLKIKFRESFRPFAPIVLAEEAPKWFAIRPEHSSPYMLVVADVIDAKRTKLDQEQLQIMQHSADLCQRVNVPRSEIPAVTHVDYSARIQTVDKVRNPLLHSLLTQFHGLTGCPVLVNTSFNVRGEPIVCTPQDAINCFLATDIDVLVLDRFIVEKNRVSSELLRFNRERHLSQFSLD